MTLSANSGGRADGFGAGLFRSQSRQEDFTISKERRYWLTKNDYTK